MLAGEHMGFCNRKLFFIPFATFLASAEAADAQHRTNLEIVPTVGHAGWINSVAFSPDGARILSGSADRKIKLWDAASGALIRTFVGHSDEVNSVAFSPDGARILSGSADRKIKLW